MEYKKSFIMIIYFFYVINNYLIFKVKNKVCVIILIDEKLIKQFIGYFVLILIYIIYFCMVQYEFFDIVCGQYSLYDSELYCFFLYFL